MTIQITDRGSQMRGELKTHARPIVEKQFNLVDLDPSMKKAVRRQEDKVLALLEDASFVYKVCVTLYL